MRTFRFALIAVVVHALAGCGGDENDAAADAAVDTSEDVRADVDGVDDTAAPDAQDAADAAVDSATDTPLDIVIEDPGHPDCDPLDRWACALPWPSSLYLEADASRETGYTLAFGETTLPANFRGVHIDPEIYRRMDGFSVGTPILVKFDNLDASALPNEYEVPNSLDADAPIVLFEVTEDGLERVPYWAELDQFEDDPGKQLLWVRPGVILQEQARYIVAFRGLLNTAGEPLLPSPDFLALRAGRGAEFDHLAARQSHFDEVFELLGDAGVTRDELILAWDFRTASSDAMHGRMLEMRSLALDAVGEMGSEITITEVEEFTEEEHDDWWLVMRGTFRAPHYMTEEIAEDRTGDVTGWQFHLDADGALTQNGWRDARFWIGVPHSARDGSPHGLVQYGHGFFGAGDGTTGHWTHNAQIANEHQFIFFGCDWTGMSEDDFGGVQFAVFDLNWFHWVPDRTHQGMIEFMTFARGMRERFESLPEVAERGIAVNEDELFYLGISQGGINGATYMALTPDITRGHLGVPGANYGLLEYRSTNFDQFFVALGGAYPGSQNWALVTQVVQLLWDTTDAATYYRHISSDPFEDDAPRRVLAAPGRGDRQVTVSSMETVARTPDSGLAVMAPYDVERPELGLANMQAYPHSGSGLVLYAFENPWPAPGNLPAPDGPENVHDAVRRVPAHNEQMVHFFRTGEIIDTCGGDGCTPE